MAYETILTEVQGRVDVITSNTLLIGLQARIGVAPDCPWQAVAQTCRHSLNTTGG